MRSIFIYLSVSILLFSCKDEVKKIEKTTSEATEEVKVIEETLQLLDNPSETKSQLPRLFSNGSELYFSWVTRKDSTDVLSYSVLKDGSWNDASIITEGNDWFTNWADFPAIAEKDGHILTNILQKSAVGTYTYDVKLNLYNSEEKKWKKNFILHNDGTQSEHGFVSILPTNEDDFFITWLDGRETAGKEHGGGQMTLRSAFVDMNGNVTDDVLLDDRVCDCCQTSAAWTSNGPIVAYRNRSDKEVRDVSVIRLVDGEWQKPVTVGNDNWKIAGCPVNGPSIDALNEIVAIAWFTAAKEEGDVMVAFSKDGGASFTDSYRIDAGSATGRVDITMINDKEAAVTWMQPKGNDEVIYLMKINIHGYTGEPIIVSKTSPERASGFPQLERVGDTLYMAWTVVEGESSYIATASVPVSKL
ncbi:MAG: hypothetical protein JKY22_09590 [Flavobacteriaceae bacterium]|nr:hypothetical protein [Flavobacteriaceae bacterium]